jgi:hypothetical protein
MDVNVSLDGYYSTETLQQLDRLRDEFTRKQITLRSVGTVYQIP